MDQARLKLLIKEKLKLGNSQRRLLYTATALLWITGVVWLILHYYFNTPLQFETRSSSLEPMMIKIHGLAAMLFLIMTGSLMMHIRRGLALKLNLLSGVSMIGLCGILTLTAWMLYYCSADAWRSNASIVHSLLGTIFPAAIFFHIMIGRKLRGR